MDQNLSHEITRQLAARRGRVASREAEIDLRSDDQSSTLALC